ncbi:hypothetical protein ABEF95_008609 [Exophiala dermatitidis]
MAKTAKVKKNPTANPKSRASRRETSPSLDVDKSVRDAPRASDATPVLAARPSAGVTKAKKKQKPLTKGQRRRHEQGLARAEIVQDQLAKKVNDASTRLKKRRERKGVWDEINGGTKSEQMRAILGQDMDQADGDDDWEDEAMEEVEMVQESETKTVEGLAMPTTAVASKVTVVDHTTSVPTTVEEDEADKIT